MNNSGKIYICIISPIIYSLETKIKKTQKASLRAREGLHTCPTFMQGSACPERSVGKRGVAAISVFFGFCRVFAAFCKNGLRRPTKACTERLHCRKQCAEVRSAPALGEP